MRFTVHRPGIPEASPRSHGVPRRDVPGRVHIRVASATRDVLYVMAVIMAIAGVVALRGLRRGVQKETEAAGAELGAQFPGEDPDADLCPTRR